MASSASREAPRARSRPATFTQAISTMNATAPAEQTDDGVIALDGPVEHRCEPDRRAHDRFGRAECRAAFANRRVSCQPSLRVVNAQSRPQSPVDVRAVPARVDLGGIHAQRTPECHLRVETDRQYADELRQHSVISHSASKNAAIAAQLGLPVRVTHHDNRRRTDRQIRSREAATDHGRNAVDGEISPSHLSRVHAFWDHTVEKRTCVDVFPGRERRKHLGLLPALHVADRG